MVLDKSPECRIYSKCTFSWGQDYFTLQDEIALSSQTRNRKLSSEVCPGLTSSRAGLGSDVLYRYSSKTHQYTYLGQHLTGISNSPYINGIDYRQSRLHISWCYRECIDSSSLAVKGNHKQQAGPNGPENNRDLMYAYSDDLGETWLSSNGHVLAAIGSKAETGVACSITPSVQEARVFEIPRNSGILNQEAQVADWEGGFWALNREERDGEERWILYHKDSTGTTQLDAICKCEADASPRVVQNCRT